MDYLKLEGQEYPFLYAVKAQREAMKANTEEKDDIYFIFLALKYGSRKEGVEFKLTEDKLYDLFEDDLDAYEAACVLLGEQMGKVMRLKTKAMKGIQPQDE